MVTPQLFCIREIQVLTSKNISAFFQTNLIISYFSQIFSKFNEGLLIMFTISEADKFSRVFPTQHSRGG